MRYFCARSIKKNAFPAEGYCKNAHFAAGATPIFNWLRLQNRDAVRGFKLRLQHFSGNNWVILPSVGFSH